MQFSLMDIWGHMGSFAKFIVYALLIMSVSSLVVAAERLVSFSKSSRESKRFAEQMGALLARGGLRDTLGMTGDKGGHLGRTIGAGLKAYLSAAGAERELVIESVARALERQASREVQSFKRGISILATVGSTAPFIGLLGTVMGIINAFQSMAASGSGGLGTVSAGISEALATTAFGLLVAIPAVMMYNFLQGWVDGRTVDLSESANEFLDLVSRQLSGIAHAA